MSFSKMFPPDACIYFLVKVHKHRDIKLFNENFRALWSNYCQYVFQSLTYIWFKMILFWFGRKKMCQIWDNTFLGKNFKFCISKTRANTNLVKYGADILVVNIFHLEQGSWFAEFKCWKRWTLGNALKKNIFTKEVIKTR